jgi:hypothetical protein
MKYLNLIALALSAILLTSGNFSVAQTSAPGGAQMSPPAGSDSSGSLRHRGERDCSKAQDPAACEARAKAREQRRQQMMQACAGKQGDDLRSCMRAQRGAESQKK